MQVVACTSLMAANSNLYEIKNQKTGINAIFKGKVSLRRYSFTIGQQEVRAREKEDVEVY